jgi:anti-sigma-K factor RskA
MTTPNHDDVRDDVGLYVLGGLDAEARSAFEAHLAACPECQADVRALMPVVAGLPLAVPQVEPPALLRERVLSLTRGQPRTLTSGRADAPPRGGLGRWAWQAAAAALIACVGLGVYAMRLQQRVEQLTVRLAEAERNLLATRSEVVEARRAVEDAESSVRVLLAPDLVRVDLAGQATAADSRGRAFFSPSTGLVFTASRLPPLPSSRVYQLWLVTATAPVSAGLLTPDDFGAAARTFPPPVADGPPVAFAVTLEPAGGVPAPTGDKVLVGLVGLP